MPDRFHVSLLIKVWNAAMEVYHSVWGEIYEGSAIRYIVPITVFMTFRGSPRFKIK